MKKELITENFVDAIFNGVSDAISVINEDFTLIDVNKFFLEMYGFSKREEVIGRKCYEVTHQITVPPTSINEPCPLRKALNTKSKVTVEHIHYDKSGGARYVEITAMPLIKNERQATNSIIHIARDITALKQYEAEFKTIFESSSDGMFFLNLATKKFMPCNPACSKMLGYSPEEFANLQVADLHLPEDLPFIIEQIGNVATSQGGTRLDIRFRRKDGTILFTDLNPALLKHSNELFALVSIRDISERKSAEQERNRLIAELQESLVKNKVLNGLLPICASCKKIRNDLGKWEHIEVYIRDRTNAEFSHGVCPDCYNKLYAKFFEEESPTSQQTHDDIK